MIADPLGSPWESSRELNHTPARSPSQGLMSLSKSRCPVVLGERAIDQCLDLARRVVGGEDLAERLERPVAHIALDGWTTNSL